MLTRDFKGTVRACVQRDKVFSEVLLSESVECLLAADLDASKGMLRNCINATVGFKEIGKHTTKSSKSLLHTSDPRATPKPKNCSRSPITSGSMKAYIPRHRLCGKGQRLVGRKTN